MKINIFSVVIMIVLFGLFNSCSNDQSPTNNSISKEIVPLKTGNSWLFKRTIFDTSGVGSKVDTITILVLRDSTIQGQKWFFTSFGTYRNDDEGLWVRDPSTMAALIFKYPIKVNVSYIFATNTMSVESVDTSISVPFGKVNCYHYAATLADYKGFKLHFYLSPGIGWIIYENGIIISGRPYLATRIELLSYSLQ